MEHVNEGNTIHGALHWQHNGQMADYGKTTEVENAGDWHIYTVDWDDRFIRTSVDGNQYFEMDISGIEIFKKNFYIIINLAVAGDMPGQDVDASKLPAQLLVDYVRVYSG
jgi:beta-glucanase (GH16 family)